jgi:Arc/MetJ-type ribon-helix-helix transcriptional regulator
MGSKQRLSASVDADLIEAAERAVERGQAETVSAWVNDALRLKLEHERRLEALAEFIVDYEAEHGEITPEEMRMAARRARSRAVSVRGPTRGRARPRRGGGGA